MRSLDKLLPGIVVQALGLDPLARRPIGVQSIDRTVGHLKNLRYLFPVTRPDNAHFLTRWLRSATQKGFL